MQDKVYHYIILQCENMKIIISSVAIFSHPKNKEKNSNIFLMQVLYRKARAGKKCCVTGVPGIRYLALLFRARICKRLWSPGIDSEESTPPGYVVWQAGTTNRVAVPARQAGIDSWAP